MIRCIAIDMDDTLLGDDLNISAENQQALNHATQLGIKVILASGRMLQSMQPYARSLGLQNPLIAYNGALIYDPVSKKPLYTRPISLEAARSVLTFFQEKRVHCNAYQNDEVYMAEITTWGKQYAADIRVAPHAVGDLAAFITEPPHKLLGIGAVDTIDRMQLLLKEQFVGTIEATRSKAIYLEILAPGVSKARALQKLADLWELDRSEVMAIGDGLNDLEMIRWAGIGVAIGNAAPQVKEAAEWVVRDHNHHGVAAAIEKIIA